MIMYNQMEVDEGEIINKLHSNLTVSQGLTDNKNGKIIKGKSYEEIVLNIVEDSGNYVGDNFFEKGLSDIKHAKTCTVNHNDGRDNQTNKYNQYNQSNQYYSINDIGITTLKQHSQSEDNSSDKKRDSNKHNETIKLSNPFKSNSNPIYSFFSIEGFNNFVISYDGKERRYSRKNVQAGKDFFKFRFISENILNLKANTEKVNSSNKNLAGIENTKKNNDSSFNVIGIKNQSAGKQSLLQDFTKGDKKIFLHAPDDKKVIKLMKIFLQKLEKSIFLFNIKSFEESFNYLFENNIIKDDSEFAELLLLTPGFDKNMIGQFLSSDKIPNKSYNILDFFVKKMNFIEEKFLDALRFFLSRINLPTDSSSILKIIERFSKTFYLDNAQALIFPDEDSVYLLCSTVLAINTLISRKELKKVRMISMTDFIRMNNRIPQNILEEIYDELNANKLNIVHDYNELIYKRLAVVLDKEGINLQTDNEDEESNESLRSKENEGIFNGNNNTNKKNVDNFGTITNLNNIDNKCNNLNNYKEFNTLCNDINDDINYKNSEDGDSDSKTKRINHNININININYNNSDINSLTKPDDKSDHLNNLNSVNNFNNMNNNINPFNPNNYNSNFSNNFSTNKLKNFNTANFAQNNNILNNSLYQSAGNFQQIVENSTKLKNEVIANNTTLLHHTNFQPDQYLLSNSNILNTLSHNENKIIGNFSYDPGAIIKSLKRGEIFLKYGRSGSPHLKQVKLSDDETQIIWRFTSVCTKIFNKAKSIQVNDLKDVYLGTHNSKIFDRFQIPFEYDRFCITIESTGRTLDLRKDNEDVIKKWFYGIKYLLDQKFKKIREKIAEENNPVMNKKDLKNTTDISLNYKNYAMKNLLNNGKNIYNPKCKPDLYESSNDEISYVWKNEILPNWKEFRNFIKLEMDFSLSNIIYLKKKKLIGEKIKNLFTDTKNVLNSKILDEKDKSDFIYFYSCYGIPHWLRKQLYSILIKNSLNISEILFNKFLKNVEKINFIWNEITQTNDMNLNDDEKILKDEIFISEENSIIESNSSIFTVKEIISDVEKSFNKFKFKILSLNIQEKDFKIQLFKILRIFTIERGDLPYSKNLAYIATIFLLNSENFYKAYLLFINFICHHSDFLFNYLIRDELFIKTRIEFFDTLFKTKLPKLFKHFKSLDISTSLFFYDWFEFVFVKCFNQTYQSFNFYQKLFDIFLIRGEVFLYELGICLMQIQQKDLLSNSVRSCLRNLKKFPLNMNGKFTEEEILDSLSEINYVQEFRAFTEENVLACEKGNLWVSLLNY